MVENKVYTKICFVCRKKFEVQNRDEWAYKKGNRFFCSYRCLRRFEKKLEEKKNLVTLGTFADELFDAGYPNDGIKFKIIGNIKQFDDMGFREYIEINESAKLYDISRGADGITTITVEVSDD